MEKRPHWRTAANQAVIGYVMLHVRYHINFKGRPTLLFAGAASDIEWLCEVFNNWRGEETNLLELLARNGPIHTLGVHALLLRLGTGDLNSCLVWKDDYGIWTVSEFGKTRIVELLKQLRSFEGPAHHYLDLEANSTQIICSKDEYTDHA